MKARTLLTACLLSAVSLSAPAGAADAVTRLATAICEAKDVAAVNVAVAKFTAEFPLEVEEIATAFGTASFFGDLGRCDSNQAIAEGYRQFKKGRDGEALDVAFAGGRVAASPAASGAGALVYQGSFAALATAGEPPSAQ